MKWYHPLLDKIRYVHPKCSVWLTGDRTVVEVPLARLTAWAWIRTTNTSHALVATKPMKPCHVRRSAPCKMDVRTPWNHWRKRRDSGSVLRLCSRGSKVSVLVNSILFKSKFMFYTEHPCSSGGLCAMPLSFTIEILNKTFLQNYSSQILYIRTLITVFPLLLHIIILSLLYDS